MADERTIIRTNIRGGPYHEDVLDELFEITPTSIPFTSSIGDTNANSVWTDWARRALTVRSDNAKTEGLVYSVGTHGSNAVLGSRVSNWQQIFNKLPFVTRTQQAMDPVGITNLMTDQVNKSQVELATDIEHAFIRGSIHSGPTNASDTGARRAGGLANVMTYVTSYGTTVTFAEHRFNAHQEAGWRRGAMLRDIIVHGRAKRWISSFTASSTKYIFSEDKMLVNAVDVYENDFYLSRIMLSHDVLPGPSAGHVAGTSPSSIYMYDRDMFEKAWLRRPSRRPLPIAADADFWELIAEGTLKFGHPAAGTIINGLHKGTIPNP